MTQQSAPAPAQASAAPAHVDHAEVDNFRRLAARWWDERGPFRELHRMGPKRIQFIRDQLIGEKNLAPGSLKPLLGLTILDVGCGGGLVCEPLARLGATVTGIDPGPETIAAARAHAEIQGLTIAYRAALLEALVRERQTFDCVVCLEVIEHVPRPERLIAECALVLKPGGTLIVSTINRTIKSFALAIVGAEFIMRWLPVGTHTWERFVKPNELARFMQAAGLEPRAREGLIYNPLAQTWSLSSDTDVNYMQAALKPGA